MSSPNISIRLKNARLASNKTLQQAAKLTDRAFTTIANYETEGKKINLFTAHILMLSEAYNVTPDYIMLGKTFSEAMELDASSTSVFTSAIEAVDEKAVMQAPLSKVQECQKWIIDNIPNLNTVELFKMQAVMRCMLPEPDDKVEL